MRGEGRKVKGEGRRVKGEGRRAKGEGRGANEERERLTRHTPPLSLPLSHYVTVPLEKWSSLLSNERNLNEKRKT